MALVLSLDHEVSDLINGLLHEGFITEQTVELYRSHVEGLEEECPSKDVFLNGPYLGPGHCCLFLPLCSPIPFWVTIS